MLQLVIEEWLTVETIPSLTLPVFVLCGHTNVFTDGTKNGPGAGLYHKVFNAFVETLKEGEIVPVNPNV